MALRNAFEGLATEATIRRLYNSLNYARDPFDRLRVIVDNLLPVEMRGMNFGWHGGSPAPWGSGSPNAMDAREIQKTNMKNNFNNVRNHRWVIS